MIERRLVHVVATARYGSFTAASEKVGVTQSAVTKSVAELERQLGFAIFNRTARGVTLTDQGLAFVDRARRLLDDADELLRGQASSHDPYEDVLRLGVCPASLEWALLPPLDLLLARYPRIRLDVSGSSFEQMVQQLRAGNVDVAFGFDAAFSEQTDLRREQLAPLMVSFFVRIGHPLLERDCVTARDLAENDMVMASDSRPYGALMRDIYESQGIDARSRMHIVDYFPLVRNIVSKTDAIGVVTVSHAESASFKTRFRLLPYLENLTAAPLCCATRGRREIRPAVRAFIKACRESRPV